MFDVTRDLDSEVLRENYEYWCAQLGGPTEPPPMDHPTRTVAAGHTFPAYKAGGSTDVSNAILFKDHALLAEATRERSGLLAVGEERRDAKIARQINLHYFVFAYLGVHDPYYGKQRSDHFGSDLVHLVPMYGVFIARELEAFPVCNVSRRDVASREASGTLYREFLEPAAARDVIYRESAVDKRHGGRFWHYWGAARYYESPDFPKEDHWQWKAEFHFRDRVDADQFEALLWPYEFEPTAAGQRRIAGAERLAEFRSAHPQCHVVPFFAGTEDLGISLVRASTAVALYRARHGTYPETIDEAMEGVPDEL